MKWPHFILPTLATVACIFQAGCASSGGAPEFANIKFIINRSPDGMSNEPVYVQLNAQAQATFEPIPLLKNVFVKQWDVVDADEQVGTSDYQYRYYQNGNMTQAFGEGKEDWLTWERLTELSWIKILPEQHAFLVVNAWDKDPYFIKFNLSTGDRTTTPTPFADNGALDTKPLRNSKGDLIFLINGRIHHQPAVDGKTISLLGFVDSLSLKAQRTVAVAGVEIVRLLSFGMDENSILAYAKLGDAQGQVKDDPANPAAAHWVFISVDLNTGSFLKIMEDTLPGYYDSHFEMAIFGRRYVIMQRVKRSLGTYFGDKTYLVDLQKTGWREITYPYDIRQRIMQNIIPVHIGGAGAGTHPISQDSLIFGQ